MATVVTNGWDLLAVANQDLLNVLLAEAYEDNIFPQTVDISEMGITFNGNLGYPTVNLNPSTTQGTNSMASIIVPVSGTLTFLGSTNTIPVGSTLSITSNLKYVSIEIQGTQAMQLYLDLQSSLAIYNVNIQSSASWVALLNGILEFYLSKFKGGTYYLGTVNMEGAPVQLLPANNIYFATQPSSAASSFNLLALIANTSTGSAGSLDFSNSPQLLPYTQGAALYISNRCLLYNMVLPILVNQLNTTNASFNVTGNATTPYKLSLNTSIAISGEYDPSLTSMDVYVNNCGQIQSDYGAKGYPISGMHSVIWVDISGHFYLTPAFTSSTQNINFSINTPDGNGSIHLSVGGWFIVGAIIVATFGTLGAAMAAVVAIVVPTVIKKLNLSVNMSSIAGNINQASTSFNWPAQKICPIDGFDFPGDMILYLNPQA